MLKKFKFFDGFITKHNNVVLDDNTYFRSVLIEDEIARYMIITTTAEYLVDMIFDEIFDDAADLGLDFEMTAEHILIQLQFHFLYVERQF